MCSEAAPRFGVGTVVGGSTVNWWYPMRRELELMVEYLESVNMT